VTAKRLSIPVIIPVAATVLPIYHGLVSADSDMRNK